MNFVKIDTGKIMLFLNEIIPARLACNHMTLWKSWRSILCYFTVWICSPVL